MAASLASYRQLSRGGAPEWWQSGAWDPKLLIARGYVQLRSTLQSSGSGSGAPARRVRGAARARVAARARRTGWRARAYGTRGTVYWSKLHRIYKNLPVLNVAFTPKTYVAPATRCELSSKVTVRTSNTHTSHLAAGPD